MTPWKVKPEDAVSGVCPLCRRALNGTRTLQKVSLSRGTCRCGRELNSKAKRRLRIWMCERKQAYTLEEAAAVAEDMRANARGLLHPYPCPFEEHYHVGAERKDI